MKPAKYLMAVSICEVKVSGMRADIPVKTAIKRAARVMIANIFFIYLLSTIRLKSQL